MTLMERRRGMMGPRSCDILTPVTALISSGSPIDTQITIDQHTVMTIVGKRPNIGGGHKAMFYDDVTFLYQINVGYCSGSKAFGGKYEPYVRESTFCNFIIDGVNHSAKWASNNSNYYVNPEPVYPTESIKLATGPGYTYKSITATVDGTLAYDLRPYLKNGIPGFLDVITGEFHTVGDGGENWTYEQ